MRYMSNNEDKDVRATVEALLFATNGLTVQELCRRTGFSKKAVETALEELEIEHSQDSRGIHIIQEGDIWKMSVKPHVTIKVKDLLPPEFPQGLVKTLALIAAKKPVKQSIIIHIRGNKAYGHVKQLLKLGFITTEPFGQTQILDLTQKFFDYFDVEPEKLEENIQKNTAETDTASEKN